MNSEPIYRMPHKRNASAPESGVVPAKYTAIKPPRPRAGWFFVRHAHAALVLLLAACAGQTTTSPPPPPPPPGPAPLPSYSNPCVVTRIYDGDTFACTTSANTPPVVVRLLYVDAPESAQRLGPLSTAILRDALPIGGTVGLRFDTDSLDSFGRTLAWVETPRFPNLNVWMAQDGWVTDLIIAPNTALAAVVRSGVNSARAAPRGLWARGFAACLPSAFRRGSCND